MWNLVVSLTNSRRSSDIFGGHNTRICRGIYFLPRDAYVLYDYVIQVSQALFRSKSCSY
jgi:hypothetical protein